MDTDAGSRGTHKHGNDGAAGHTRGEAFLDFGRGKVLALQILLHQFVVGFGSGLHQDHPGFLNLVGKVVRQFRCLTVVAHPGDLRRQVHDAPEVECLPNGQMERHESGPGTGILQALQGTLPIGILAVHLVDQNCHRLTFGLDPRPRQLGADLGTSHRIHQNQSHLGCGNSADHFAQETRVARRVNEVDLGAVVYEGGNRQAKGNAARLLLVIEVAHRRAVRRIAHAGNGATVVEQRLHQSGLAGTAVPQQGNVANVGHREFSHAASSNSACEPARRRRE